MNAYHSISCLTNISNKLNGIGQIKCKLFLIMDEIIEAFGLEDCVIYLADPKEKKLIQYAASSNKRGNSNVIENQLHIDYGIGIVGSAVAERKVEIVNDTSNDSRYLMDDARRFSEITTPIIMHEIPVGALDSEHSDKNFFSQEHQQFFSILSTMIAPYLAKISVQGNRQPNYYFNEFKRLLEEEQVYRNAQISLVDVAQMLHIHASYLSEILNRESKKNFSTIINEYRVSDVKKMLLDHNYKNFSILGIAMESGFNSKGTFNRVFKREVGLSPQEYIQLKGMLSN